VKLAKGRLDAVVDGAGGAAMNEYLKVLRPGGIISHYGATAGQKKE
jgi:NADPH:quinone reductase-like Zn-dependent oxidoreductase